VDDFRSDADFQDVPPSNSSGSHGILLSELVEVSDLSSQPASIVLHLKNCQGMANLIW